MILQELAAFAQKRADLARRQVGLEEMRQAAAALPKAISFETALKRPGLSFICEVKRPPPQRDHLRDFPYRKIARNMRKRGPTAFLPHRTQVVFRLGSDLSRHPPYDFASHAPQGFSVDEYQLYEAKCMGADAVAAHLRALDTKTVARLWNLLRHRSVRPRRGPQRGRNSLGAVGRRARLIGVNNRNLKDFQWTLPTPQDCGIRSRPMRFLSPNRAFAPPPT